MAFQSHHKRADAVLIASQKIGLVHASEAVEVKLHILNDETEELDEVDPFGQTQSDLSAHMNVLGFSLS